MPNAEPLYEGYSVSKGIDRNSAVVTFYLSGLSDQINHDQMFAAVGVQRGQLYPFGDLQGAICTDLRASRWCHDKGLVVAYFNTRQWGFRTRVIAQLDIDLRTVTAPHFFKLLMGPPGDNGPVHIGWREHENKLYRKRGVITKYRYSSTPGEISDATAHFIAQQVGKIYVFGSGPPSNLVPPPDSGYPYLFTGATATATSNGLTNIRYAFLTTTALKELRPGVELPANMMYVPELGPLDEYVWPIEDENDIATIETGVLPAADNYGFGEVLP